MTNFNFLLNNLSYLSSEDLVGRPMDSTCFRSAPVPLSFRLRLHPLRMVATLLLLLCLGVGNVWGTDPVATLDPVDGESYVVAFWNGTKYYALPNIGTSSSTYDGTEITVNASGYVTSDNPPLWKFEKASSGTYKGDWHLSYKKSATTYYLYKNGTGGSNYKISALTSSSTYWRFTKSSNKYNVVATDRGTTSNTRLTYSSSKWKVTGNSSTTYDIILLQPAPAGPTITTSSSMTTFGCNMTTGVPVKQSFTVSGTALTNNITVTPPSGYEVCLTENGTYTSSVELSKGSGTLSSTTIYVKLKDDNAAGSYSGNISCVSSGATTKNVAVSGSTPFKVTWKANGTTHATTYVTYATGTGTALGSLPDDPDPSDYTCSPKAFYGWYDGASYSNASVAPSVISTSTKITTDKTYNAVYATASGGAATWDKVTSASGITEGTYVIVYDDSYYLPSETEATKNPSVGSGITVSGSSLSNTVTSDMQWTFSGTSSAWTVSHTSGLTTYYLGSTDAAQGITVTTSNSSYTWTVGNNSSPYSGIHLRGDGSTRFLTVYSNSSWRYYSDSGDEGEVTLYKKSGGTTYSAYSTTCCTPLGTINGSVLWSNGTLLGGGRFSRFVGRTLRVD